MSIQSVISGSYGYSDTYSTTSANSSSSKTSMDQMKSEFDALAKALKDGNLSAAQTAFATIQKDMPQPPGSSSSSSTTSDTSNSSTASTSSTSASSSTSSSSSGPGADFAALAKALQSGDLSAAQTAFTKLQNDRPQGPPPGGPPPGSDSSSTGSSSSTNSSSTLDLTGSTLSLTA